MHYFAACQICDDRGTSGPAYLKLVFDAITADSTLSGTGLDSPVNDPRSLSLRAGADNAVMTQLKAGVLYQFDLVNDDSSVSSRYRTCEYLSIWAILCK